jgi:hypothetical protein
MSFKQREGAVLQLHGDALQGLLRAFNRDFQQLQDQRLVLAEHFTRGDAEEEGVADVAGRAGDRHADGGLGGHGLLR